MFFQFFQFFYFRDKNDPNDAAQNKIRRKSSPKLTMTSRWILLKKYL